MYMLSTHYRAMFLSMTYLMQWCRRGAVADTGGGAGADPETWGGGVTNRKTA